MATLSIRDFKNLISVKIFLSIDCFHRLQLALFRPCIRGSGLLLVTGGIANEI
jgi:hypothetical protein